MQTRPFYNFVIAGGGPAGLAAGIAAAKNGFSAIIVEQGAQPGPRTRGESVRRYSYLDKLLGKDFFEKGCFEMGGNSVYHSPGNLHQFRLASNIPLYFFEWRKLIDRLVSTAEKMGVTILCNSRIIGPIRNSHGTCIGLKYLDAKETIHEVFGNVTLACDGHQSTIGRQYGVPYDTMNCPMVKCLAINETFSIEKTPDLQFYLIGNGDLTYSPDFPQSIAYMFPIGGHRMELGLMLRMTHAYHMKKTVKIPDQKGISDVWQRLKHDYPEFHTYFQNAVIEHEEFTGLSNAHMVSNFVPGAGTVLIGDSAGFIDPFGSSGIYFGMAMADFWVDQLSDKMKEIAGHTSITMHLDDLWTPQTIRAFNKAFKKTKIYQKVKNSYSTIGKFEWYAFKHLRTASRVNKRWKLLSRLMRMA